MICWDCGLVCERGSYPPQKARSHIHQHHVDEECIAIDADPAIVTMPLCLSHVCLSGGSSLDVRMRVHSAGMCACDQLDILAAVAGPQGRAMQLQVHFDYLVS